MVKYCPVCREDNLSNARFCSSCGSVIAHIEATFSGFGTSEIKEAQGLQTVTCVPAPGQAENSELVDRLVGLSQAHKSSQAEHLPKKFWRGPNAVAALAAFTVVALMASLVLIVKGQPTVEAKGPRQAALKPAEPIKTLIAKPEVTSSVEASQPVANPQPLPSAEPLSPALGGQREDSVSTSKPPKAAAKTEAKNIASRPANPGLASNAVKSKEPRSAAPAPGEIKGRVRGNTSASSSEPPKSHPIPEAIRQEPNQAPSAMHGSAVVPLKQAEVAVQAKGIGETGKAQGNRVETLCSDRSNFLTRGFCHNQYCAEPQRKNDPTCQRLRQYEMARQNVNY